MSIHVSRPIAIERIFVYGGIGGIIAGIAMLLVEIVGALLTAISPLMPVQMNAAILLGPTIAGLERIGMAPLAAATTTTILVGLGTHLILTIIYGMIFALIVVAVPPLRSSVWMLTVVGIGFGLALWVVNNHLIVTAASPWFLSTSVTQQVAAHALFGGALGYYLGAQLVTRVRVVSPKAASGGSRDTIERSW